MHHAPNYLRHKTHKNCWIKSLLAKNQKAKAVVLEEHPTAQELPRAEIELIAYFRYIGCDLTNGTDGGEGGSPMKGKKHSKETKDKISAAHKNLSEEIKLKQIKRLKERPAHLGHKHSETTKIQMSKSQRGKHSKQSARINNLWINKLRKILRLGDL